MERLSIWLQGEAAHWGILGLVLIAFLDSSFLSLPEINDLLVVTAAVARPELMPAYALAAAFGSVLGCLTLYTIGKKGGARLLEAKLDRQRVERLQALYRRFDLLAVLVPSLLPPPCPFKIFVLGSGVFRMPLPRFLLAVAVGRSSRYLIEGWLAVRYGRQVLDTLQQHPLQLSLVMITVALLVLLSVRLARRLVERSH